ncbi:hypothetical protein DL238_09235 [Alteriqipengyuania lutimaris]|uniref:Tail specific protease domain-containing protein n=2 Tax=Alteriqipengyuania lutimaris TaxID=1538146 RepID=A0A395LPI0_9SPHN|nr:hypothetical protein DL238_09235 [Alteriqipengyuania lutimaris]
MREEVIGALGDTLRESYVFPDVAGSLAPQLESRRSSGAYRDATTASAFADALTQDMRRIGEDAHFRVRYDPAFTPYDAESDGPPDDTEIARMREMASRMAYGLPRIQRLPGNVGYLEVRGFLPTHDVAPAYEAAMTLLAGSDAIIIDLRSNGGGEPESVTRLMSHFFPVGTELLVNSIYDRTQDSTREFWLDPDVQTRFAGPVYVLTSDVTFSGGEELAYDMQTHARGTLVGETTGGGANPGDMMPLAHGFIAFIPTGRAINPVTGTNWEHTGVVPDVAVPADRALSTALALALDKVADDIGEPGKKRKLAELSAEVRAGNVSLPDWTHPRKR